MKRFYSVLCAGAFALAVLAGLGGVPKADAATVIATDSFAYDGSFVEVGTLPFSIPQSGLYEFSFDLLSGAGFGAFGLEVESSAGFGFGSVLDTNSFQGFLLGPDLAPTFGDYELLFAGLGSTGSGSYSLTVSLVSAIPEASTWSMMIAGLGLLGWRTNAIRRRRGASAQALAA